MFARSLCPVLQPATTRLPATSHWKVPARLRGVGVCAPISAKRSLPRLRGPDRRETPILGPGDCVGGALRRPMRCQGPILGVLLWMDEIHFAPHQDTMGNHCWLVFTGDHIMLGFLRWCRISSIHGMLDFVDSRFQILWARFTWFKALRKHPSTQTGVIGLQAGT